MTQQNPKQRAKQLFSEKFNRTSELNVYAPDE